MMATTWDAMPSRPASRFRSRSHSHPYSPQQDAQDSEGEALLRPPHVRSPSSSSSWSSSGSDAASLQRFHHAHSYSHAANMDFDFSNNLYPRTTDIGHGTGPTADARALPSTPLQPTTFTRKQINNIVIDTSRLQYPSDLNGLVSPRSSFQARQPSFGGSNQSDADHNQRYSAQSNNNRSSQLSAHYAHSYYSNADAEIPLLHAHPINANMPYALRQRDLGPDEESMYNSVYSRVHEASSPTDSFPSRTYLVSSPGIEMGTSDTNDRYLPYHSRSASPASFHKALVPMYYSPTADSMSAFPYKNSVTPSRYTSNAMPLAYPMAAVPPKAAFSLTSLNSAPDLVHSSRNRSFPQPRPDDYDLLKHNPTQPDPQESRDALMARMGYKAYNPSASSAAIHDDIHPPSQPPPIHPIRIHPQTSASSSFFWLDKEQARPKWAQTPPLASCTASRVLLALCALFPPTWLLMWYGVFDDLVGTVPRKYKLAALGCSVSFFLVVIACLIVGLVVGTS